MHVASAVVEETVVGHWLWRNRIPQYKVTIVNGDWGSGKTTAVCSAIAHIFNKEEFPDGEVPEIEPGHVFFITTESDETEIGNKLHAQGMDQDDIARYVHVLDYVEQDGGELSEFDLDRDIMYLDREVDIYHPVLIIWDPLLEFHSRKEIDSKAIRGLMVRLQRLCLRWKTTMIALLHWNKNEKLSRHNRMAGSSQYGAGVKSVIIVWRDEKNKELRHFEQVKMNLGPEPPTIAFEIQKPDGILVWTKVEGMEPSTKLDAAMAWITKNCVQPKLVKDCITQSGFPERTLKRARAALGERVKTREIMKDGKTQSHWEMIGDHNNWGLDKVELG